MVHFSKARAFFPVEYGLVEHTWDRNSPFCEERKMSFQDAGLSARSGKQRLDQDDDFPSSHQWLRSHGPLIEIKIIKRGCPWQPMTRGYSHFVVAPARISLRHELRLFVHLVPDSAIFIWFYLQLLKSREPPVQAEPSMITFQLELANGWLPTLELLRLYQSVQLFFMYLHVFAYICYTHGSFLKWGDPQIIQK